MDHSNYKDLQFVEIKTASELGLGGTHYQEYLYKQGLVKKLPHPYVPGSQTTRPYVVGFGCDGSFDANIHYVVQRMVEKIGWDYAKLYEAAYPDERGKSWIHGDLGELPDEALKSKKVRETTLVPQNVTIQEILEELTEINNHSLRDKIEERFEKAGIELDTRLRALKPKVIFKCEDVVDGEEVGPIFINGIELEKWAKEHEARAIAKGLKAEYESF